MPNFYNETYMKDGLHAQNKMNSLARSNASLYGGQVPPGQVPNGAKDDLYDRLRRHAYQGKKSGKWTFPKYSILNYNLKWKLSITTSCFCEIKINISISDKSGNETTSDSDGQ